ncbi:NTP transferase domain-containing protein [Parapedobacter tibetensis]|nr:NTP transferase domain-containing protein [Parapedobacter tibetensis]
MRYKAKTGVSMHATSRLYGLVLAGGKSIRMGRDKGALQYHQTNQRTYLYRMLDQFCAETYISCRSDQQHIMDSGLPHIVDKNVYGGPLNGMLTAHRAHPNRAWLVVAVDLPFLSAQSIQSLVENRDPKKVATVYAGHGSNLPEPLVGIWEPHGLALLAESILETTNRSPRNFLINADTKLVSPENDLELFNANSPEDYEEAKILYSRGVI